MGDTMIKLARAGIFLMMVVMSAPFPSSAQIPEEGFLEGKFKVRCPLGHDDIVSGITHNHTCEKGPHKSVVKGSAILVCPDGHMNPVGNITRSHKCWICEKECRL